MAKAAASGPASFAEGMRGVAQAITDAMTTPDAGPHMPALQDMQKLAIGIIQHVSTPQPPAGGAPPPGAAPGGPPGAMPPGGGTNIGQLKGPGGPPLGPSAGPTGGPSLSGASADDVRRLVAQTAGGGTT